MLGSGGCVHSGLPVCLLVPGLSLGSTAMMAAQFSESGEGCLAQVNQCGCRVLRPQLGIPQCEQRPARLKGAECQVWGLGWRDTALSKHSENSTEPGVTPNPLWAGQVNWKKTFCWYQFFSSWGPGLSCPGRPLSLGLTVQPLRDLLTQPYWHHCRAITLNPRLSVNGILLLLSMAACFRFWWWEGIAVSAGMSAATFSHAL